MISYNNASNILLFIFSFIIIRTRKKKCCQVCRENCQSYKHPQQITWHGNSFRVLTPSTPANTRQLSLVCSKDISYIRVSLIVRTKFLAARNYRYGVRVSSSEYLQGSYLYASLPWKSDWGSTNV